MTVPKSFNGGILALLIVAGMRQDKWAEEHDITQDDVDNYSGNSNSFMEGMQSYVDEN